MFDKVEIVVKGGDGGDGAISFRREKFVPRGGPDGGDGGDGGDVILLADPAVSTLLRLEPKQVYRAGNGGHGAGSRKHGRRGKDLALRVPVGTVVNRAQDSSLVAVADLAKPGDRVVVARSGHGGFGNSHFVSPTNQAPRIAQKGEKGEEASLVLEMRLIADVGIIGRPNAGKSSLLAAASAAKPKIASYPFTTREPILGVAEVGDRSFVMAEIPGLIQDAHLGRGLGHDFLRHALRTRVLVHLIDGTSASPVADMAQINRELEQFNASMAAKPQIVVVNKIDLPEVRSRMDGIRGAFERAGITVAFISAATREGVPELLKRTLNLLAATEQAAPEAQPVLRVFRPQPRRERIVVRKEADAFVIDAPELERIVERADLTHPDASWELRQQLARLGVSKALEKAGARPGDKVRLGKLEWEW